MKSINICNNYKLSDDQFNCLNDLLEINDIEVIDPQPVQSSKNMIEIYNDYLDNGLQGQNIVQASLICAIDANPEILLDPEALIHIQNAYYESDSTYQDRRA